MAISQVEYVGFRNGATTRDYVLAVRHADGSRDEYVVAIEHAAFAARRARYQDGAEICYLKLRRAVAAWTLAPESGPLAARQDVTEAELLAYREEHEPRPRIPRPARPTEGAR